MLCLVTGVAGFLGSHLAERLIKEGLDVWGIDSFTPYYSRKLKEANLATLKSNKFTLLEVSVEEFPYTAWAKENIDYVFHFAAQPGVRASWGKDFKIYNKDNVIATQCLLEWAKDKNIKKFVYASSSSVYGNADNLPTGEDTVPKPISPYGITKLAAENLCFAYAKNYGIITVALRFFTVYGPRQRPDMAFHKFIISALKDKPINVYGKGDSIRDFTYIEDAIEGTILAWDKGSNTQVYNIGRGYPIKLKDAISILEEVLKKNINISYLSSFAGDVEATHADISKAKSFLSYSPKKDLKEGLEEEVEWIKRLYRL